MGKKVVWPREFARSCGFGRLEPRIRITSPPRSVRAATNGRPRRAISRAPTGAHLSPSTHTPGRVTTVRSARADRATAVATAAGCVAKPDLVSKGPVVSQKRPRSLPATLQPFEAANQLLAPTVAGRRRYLRVLAPPAAILLRPRVLRCFSSQPRISGRFPRVARCAWGSGQRAAEPRAPSTAVVLGATPRSIPARVRRPRSVARTLRSSPRGSGNSSGLP